MDNLLVETRVQPKYHIQVEALGPYGRRHTKLVPDRRLGRTLEWQRIAGPGCWVGWCEETRACQLLLSVPRIHNLTDTGLTSNFPLHDFASIDEMRLTEVSKVALWLLGVRLADGADPVRVLGLPGWIVRRIAYAADVPMDEASTLLGELAALPRKRQPQVKVWGRPGRHAHAVEWESGGQRLQFYRKDLQLERRIRGLRSSDDDLGRVSRAHHARVAALARNVVRLEVTLRNLRAIRGALGFDAPWAPTFRLMAQRHMGDFFFGRELERLRLVGVRHDADLGDGVTDVNESDGAEMNDAADLLREEWGRRRDLWKRFVRAQQRDSLSELGRRDPIRPARLRALFATYLLYGTFTREELLATGYATSTLGKDLRQLARLGLPPVGAASTVIQTFLEDYLGKLHALMPGIRTELPEEPGEWTGLVEKVPWADDDDAVEAEGDDLQDVTASGFEDLLNQSPDDCDAADSDDDGVEDLDDEEVGEAACDCADDEEDEDDS